MIRHIMPWKATGPGDLTILRAPGRRLTKLVTESGVIGYEGAAAFEPEAWRIDDVEDIAELLADLARPSRIRASSAARSSPSSPIGRRCCGDHAIVQASRPGSSRSRASG